MMERGELRDPEVREPFEDHELSPAGIQLLDHNFREPFEELEPSPAKFPKMVSCLAS